MLSKEQSKGAGRQHMFIREGTSKEQMNGKTNTGRSNGPVCGDAKKVEGSSMNPQTHQSLRQCLIQTLGRAKVHLLGMGREDGRSWVAVSDILEEGHRKEEAVT